MEKGTVVAFPVKGQPRLAVVEGPEGKQSLRVVDTFGNSLVVPARDLTFSSADYKLSERRTATPETLDRWSAQASEKSAGIDLRPVWELLEAEGVRTSSLEDLAGWLWSDLDGPGAYALFSALNSDKIYFKSKGSAWEVRTTEQVTEAEKQSAATVARARDQQQLASRFLARSNDKKAPVTDEDQKRLDALRAFVLWEDEAPGKNLALEVLGLLGRPKTPESAFQLLVEVGVWSRHQNLDLARTGRSAGFDPDLLEDAEALAALPCPKEGRLDLRSQLVVTIDDETTTEIDDGLGLEILPDGGRVFWIHIADPAAFVPPESRLDLEARKRGATLYLPEGRLTMFPTVLAEGPLSLRPGKETAALSFACRLAPDGALVSWDIHRSVVQPARRVTYAEAETWLSPVAESSEKDEDFEVQTLIRSLDEGARVREKWRLGRGAVAIDLPEAAVKVFPEADEVEIGLVSRLRSRDLVAEFMVLAGEACARFFRDRGIPVLYRTQSFAENPVDLDPIPPGPAREFAKIFSMSRSVSAIEPAPHSGLGLEVYVQATSPIRRYADLAAHRQLHAVLEEKPLAFDKEGWETLAGELDPLVAQASKLERQADRYWTIEYLRRQKGRVWNGLVVGWFREDERQAQVLLTETGLRTVVKLAKTKALGSELRLKVSAADPRKDLLTFQEM